MTVSKGRIALLAGLSLAMILLWDYPFMWPFKVFVVYLHEISHGLGAILTGGSVKAIVVEWDQSGYAETIGGNFLAIASAGYIGSILWGSAMLTSALNERFTRALAVIIGLVFLFFTIFYLKQFMQLIFFFGLAWGLLFITTGILYEKANRLLMFVMGGLTSLYGLYDLGDFFRGEVLQTDAGIIANYYLKGSPLKLTLAYAIGILISLLSIWLLYRIIMHAVHVKEELPEEHEAEDLPAGLSPEVLALLEQIQKEKENNN